MKAIRSGPGRYRLLDWGGDLLKPCNPGGHPAYQQRVLAQLRKYYPDAVSSLSASTWEIMEKFWNLDLSDMDSLLADRYFDFGSVPRLPSDMLRSTQLSVECKVTSYTKWAADLKEKHLHAILSGFPVGDSPGVGTFYDFHSRLRIADKDNLSDPVHPPKEKPKKPDRKGKKAPPVEKVTEKELLEQFELHPPADMAPCGRLYGIFKELFLARSQDGLLDLRSLSLAGDGTPVYTAARERPPVYKDDFTIGDDGVPICREGHPMRRDGTESAKGKPKFKCSKTSFAGGTVTCTCENPCSTAKYGRTVHLVMKDNPRLFNDPPRSSKEWKLEYNARTSAERCNKREKVDYKLEDGRYRSSKMWYCRLFAIMMCQHLDAWGLPKTSRLKDAL